MKVLNQTDFNKLQALNFVIDNKSDIPSNPVQGQLYLNTTLGALYCFIGTDWVDVSSSELAEGNYNQLVNKPIANLIGTQEEPIILDNLGVNTYNISGYYKYNPSDTSSFYTTRLFALILDSDGTTRRILFGDNGISFGMVQMGYKFNVGLDAIFSGNLKTNSLNVVGLRTEKVGDMYVENIIE